MTDEHVPGPATQPAAGRIVSGRLASAHAQRRDGELRGGESPPPIPSIPKYDSSSAPQWPRRETSTPSPRPWWEIPASGFAKLGLLALLLAAASVTAKAVDTVSQMTNTTQPQGNVALYHPPASTSAETPTVGLTVTVKPSPTAPQVSPTPVPPKATATAVPTEAPTQPPAPAKGPENGEVPDATLTYLSPGGTSAGETQSGMTTYFTCESDGYDKMSDPPSGDGAYVSAGAVELTNGPGSLPDCGTAAVPPTQQARIQVSPERYAYAESLLRSLPTLGPTAAYEFLDS